jgi:sugar phosphate isomerase/epimerase
MRFSLAHLTVLGCAPPEMIYIAARAGYDFVSPRIIMMGNEKTFNYALAENPAMLRETKAALNETGLKVHDIELARICDGMKVNSFLPAFEVAAELGAPHVLCSVWTSDRNYAVERFAEVCDLAEPLGLTVNLEFVTWSELTTLHSAVEVLRAANRSNVGLVVDMLHFHRSRVRLEELDAVPKEWFNFAHLCDAPAEIPADREALIFTGREDRLYLGEGGIDVAAIVARMPEITYSIELPNRKRVAQIGYEGHATECLTTARAYLSAVHNKL